MTNRELYRNLVDLYAGDELSEEMVEELRWASLGDPELELDMSSLKLVVAALRSQDDPTYDDDTDERIKTRIRAGVPAGLPTSKPSHLQYRLPMQG